MRQPGRERAEGTIENQDDTEMTIRELYFIIAAFGTAVFLMLALITYQRNGWRFPFNWYTAIMIYLASVCITFLPVFDNVRDSSVSTTGYIIHDCATRLISPLLMLAFLRISMTVRKIKLQTVLFIFLPFALYDFCFHYVTDTTMLLNLCYVYIVGTSIWWAHSIRKQVYFVHLKPQVDTNEDDEEEVDNQPTMEIRWMRLYTLVICVATIIYWGIRTFVPLTETVAFKPHLIFIMAFVLPFVIIYEWQYSLNRYFDKYKITDPDQQNALAGNRNRKQEEKDSSEMTALAAKVMMQNRMKLPSNAILPHLTAASTRNGAVDRKAPLSTHGNANISVIESEDPKAVREHIAEGLRKLEENDPFYLEKEVTAGVLAKKLKVSRSSLNAYFREEGTTFYNYIERLRVIYAGEQIEKRPTSTLDAICFASGFSSRSNFNMAFSNYYHVSPEDYKAQRL